MKTITAGSGKGLRVAATDYTDGHMACWFSLPRAIEADGRTFIGGVQSSTASDYNDVYSSLFPVHNGGKIVTIECGVPKKFVDYNSYSDDHNNPSYLFFSDKPPVTFVTQHNADDGVIVRKGTTPLDLTTFGEPEMLDFTAVGSAISYSQTWRRAGQDKVICLSRMKIPGGSTYIHKPVYWSLAISEDYCETWSNKQVLIDFTDQGYIMSNLDPDGVTLHVGGSMHPDRNFGQSIIYFSINLDTGDIKKRDGTVIANVDGTNLPLSYNTDPDQVFTVSEPDRTWIKDVGPDGSIVWAQWNQDTESHTGGDYKHAKWNGGAWSTTSIVGNGGAFGNNPVANGGTQTYRGGASVDPNGDVFLSRKRPDGRWAIERWTLSGSWSLAETIHESLTRLIRPYCPVNRVSGPRVIWHEVYEYTSPGLYRAAARWEGYPSA